MDQITARRNHTVQLGIPTFTDTAGRTSTNPPSPNSTSVNSRNSDNL